jgi:hypothetical protein
LLHCNPNEVVEYYVSEISQIRNTNITCSHLYMKSKIIELADAESKDRLRTGGMTR